MKKKIFYSLGLALIVLSVIMVSFLYNLSNIKYHKAAIDSLHLDWIDKNISPAQNFYFYANGNWEKNTPFRPGQYLINVAALQQEKNFEILHHILEKMLSHEKLKPGSTEQKLLDYYYSGMDEATINKVGIAPLKSEFEQIQSMRNSKDFQKIIAHLSLLGINPLFSFKSQRSDISNTKYIGLIDDPDFTLPNQQYYIDNDAYFQKVRLIFCQNIAKMFELLGDNPKKAQKESEIILKIETLLAQNDLSAKEAAGSQLINIKKLKNDTIFSWQQYFADVGMSDMNKNSVYFDVRTVKNMNNALHAISISEWTSYFRWRLIYTFSPYLPKPYGEIIFHITQVMQHGLKQKKPRWFKVIHQETFDGLDFALSELFIKRYMIPGDLEEIKHQILKMTDEIRTVFRHRLESESWVKTNTRKMAIKKLNKIQVRLGYPSKPFNYSDLKIDRGPYVMNKIKINKFLVQKNLSRVDKKIDRDEWNVPLLAPLAYYANFTNTIYFPIGVFQSLSSKSYGSSVEQYSVLGFTIAHEMSHAFGIDGVRHDSDGQFKNWLDPKDLQQFKEKISCVVTQFSHYSVNNERHLNGASVANEAIADLSGISLAFDAFHASSAYKKVKPIHGYTADQQFFLTYAHSKREKYSAESSNFWGIFGTHPMGMNRVNGTLVNIPEFQKAFHIPENSPMAHKNRCKLW